MAFLLCQVARGAVILTESGGRYTGKVEERGDNYVVKVSGGTKLPISKSIVAAYYDDATCLRMLAKEQEKSNLGSNAHVAKLLRSADSMGIPETKKGIRHAAFCFRRAAAGQDPRRLNALSSWCRDNGMTDGARECDSLIQKIAVEEWRREKLPWVRESRREIRNLYENGRFQAAVRRCNALIVALNESPIQDEMIREAAAEARQYKELCVQRIANVGTSSGPLSEANPRSTRPVTLDSGSTSVPRPVAPHRDDDLPAHYDHQAFIVVAVAGGILILLLVILVAVHVGRRRVSQVPVHVSCPQCGSSQFAATNKGYGAGAGCLGFLIAGPLGLLCGCCGQNDIFVTCLACGHRWKAGRR